MCTQEKKNNEQDKDNELDKFPSQTLNQEASLDPIPKTGIVHSSNVSLLDTSFDDINVPIAIRKGVRSCT